MYVKDCGIFYEIAFVAWIFIKVSGEVTERVCDKNVSNFNRIFSVIPLKDVSLASKQVKLVFHVQYTESNKSGQLYKVFNQSINQCQMHLQ